MFISDGHPAALEDIWMILSGEDIADIRCFLVGLVIGDNWQYDHEDDSQCWETGLCCNRCGGRLGPKANLLIYEVVQGGHHEEHLLLQETIMRNKQDKIIEFRTEQLRKVGN
jgi:hypothetical protein